MRNAWFTRIFVTVTVATALTLSSGTAFAGRSTPNVSFFGSGSYVAGWTNVGGDHGQVIQLGVDETSYAGAYFHRVEGTAPTTAPSFDLMASIDGNSGGSPRLVLYWTDGGTSELRPLTWTGSWQTVDGAVAGSWDNNGGTCGYRYGTDYDTTRACHTGETIASAYIVTDSGWLNGAYTNLIDNVQIAGVTFSSANSNNGK